ncbi:MAG: NAD-dependent epimerase/dehydratase family protein [Litorimonas sp.]
MKIIVTGTAGFIGNALALVLLRDGHDVFGVDSLTDHYDVSLKRDRLKRLDPFDRSIFLEASLLDMEAMSGLFTDCDPDVVVHLAAQPGVRYSLEHPRAFVDTNVTGSFNVIELCKRHEVDHLVLASTSSAYGANETYPFAETDRAAYPLTIYAATKLASEMIAHSHSHLYDLPTTVVRFFTVYGPWGRPDMAPFLFTKAMFEGRAIDVFNHGRMMRDFTYVDDIVTAIRKLTDVPPERGKPIDGVTDSLSPAAPYRLVNIGNADPVPLMEFIREIERNVGVKAKMNMLSMQPGDVKKTYAETHLLHALTGFRPSVGIEEGVKSFVDWYRDYYRL